ncbi:MAG: thioredoxin family protein [Candidatus Cohnella colombiensis]|uniref:Thioredoxin family protein n=1 Tax=Candidatus Cohnella colombiensis TaxID=3121368 RepID=A0AA95JHA5_9BACL|nr:MAG: thioredoxin family protein [Cohnella sp.]
MDNWKPANWKRDWTFTPAPFAVFVHTPLCGTCAVAKRMLTVVEQMQVEIPIFTANLNVMPSMAQHFQIESVPCLLMKRRDGSWSKLYRFSSVPDIIAYLEQERGV